MTSGIFFTSPPKGYFLSVKTIQTIPPHMLHAKRSRMCGGSDVTIPRLEDATRSKVLKNNYFTTSES